MQRPRGPSRRSHRLRSGQVIRHVLSSGRRFPSASFVCVALVEGTEPGAFGVVAGRRVGGAVARNRAKRRLREAVLPALSRLRVGARVVLIATGGTNRAEFQELVDELAAALERTQVLDAGRAVHV